MKKLIKRLAVLILALVLIFSAVAYPYIKRGYDLYSEAVRKMSIEDKVAQIRSSDSFADFDEISPYFTKALLKAEDRRFYYHFAIDPIALVRASLVNVFKGKYVQGGSTITQQLAKNMYFSFEKQMERKIAELFVAWQLEKLYTKNEILTLYCNVVYFGEDCYGIKQASEYYYKILPLQLDESQSKELVDALKAPSVSNPSTD